MIKSIQKLMVFGVVLFFAIVFIRSAGAENKNPLESQTPSWVIPATQGAFNTELAQNPEINQSDKTLKPIPGFAYVTKKMLIEMFCLQNVVDSYPSDILSKWPNVVYMRNPDTGRFFNPKTGVLDGEFGKLEVIQKKQGKLEKAVIRSPIRGETPELTAHEIIKGQDFGQLTKLVNNNGEEEYVVITEVFYRFPVLSFTRGGWIVKYIDKDCEAGKHKEKYLDLFITQLGWNRIFYQP